MAGGDAEAEGSHSRPQPESACRRCGTDPGMIHGFPPSSETLSVRQAAFLQPVLPAHVSGKIRVVSNHHQGRSQVTV